MKYRIGKKRRKVLPITVAIFILILAITALVLNRDQKEEKIRYDEILPSSPTLPTIAFEVEGQKVNTLLAYAEVMHITAARETITPLDPSGQVNIVINDYAVDVQAMEYEVTTLDGKTSLISGSVEKPVGQVTLNLDATATNTEETVLKIKLLFADKEAYYYTRLISYNKLMLEENLKKVAEIHSAIYDDSQLAYLETIFGSKLEQNPDLSKVSLNASALTVAWSGIEVDILGDVKWTLTDATSNFVNTQLSYIVTIDDGYYWVNEYLRTSYSSAKKAVELKDYHREVNQVLDYRTVEVVKGTLELGMIGKDSKLMVSENEQFVVFEQAKELFLYDIVNNVFTKVYNSALDLTVKEIDERDYIREYDIEILDVDDLGNVSYSLYGYMNKGEKEGLVGNILYEFDYSQKVSIERAFVEQRKAFSIGKDELRESIRYSKVNNEIYLLANQSIHKVSLDTLEQVQISQKLNRGEYYYDVQGDYIAFNSGEADILSEVTVLNIESGEEHTFTAKDGENIHPLGFIDEDIILGYAKKSDMMRDYRGREITPCYEVVIVGSDNKVAKTYSNKGNYIESIRIEGRVIYLTQVAKKGDIYTLVEEDYIANNLEQEESQVLVKHNTDADKGALKYLVFPGESVEKLTKGRGVLGTTGDEIRVSYPLQEYEDNYYVYARGDMVGMYDNLVDAIIKADLEYGAVINGNQQYLWRRGARSLVYDNLWIESRVKAKLKRGISSVDVINEMAPGNVHIYTGTTVENMCYLIQNDQTIGVRFNSGEWGILVGYDNAKVYYLDKNGDKKSISLSTVDTQVETILGSSKF